MKDSGIKWIGEIPEKWGKCRLKNVITIENGKEIMDDGGNIPVYGSGGIFKFTDRPIFVGQSLLMGRKGTIDKPMLVDGPFWTLDTMFYTSRIENINARFLYYACSGLINFDFYKSGSVLPSMTQTELYNVWITLPSPSEQQAIAAFLDKKCFVIDNLISNETKQIEKLKEYRQAIITKAVTKGLDPNAPMKDSGIEWIGEIPNNVNVSSVKNFYDITLGKMLQPKQESENDTLEYYFCAANLGNDCLKTNDLKQMWFSVKEKEKYSLKRGDLLVVEGGDVASSSIISTDVSNIYFQNSIHRVRPIHGLNEYLHYYLIFVKGSGYFDVNCNKATIMHFTKDKFSNLPLLIRNTEEQKKIVTFLNKEETKINRLISIKEKKIEFLTNYKKSLIYEYVTGKKRVSL